MSLQSKVENSNVFLQEITHNWFFVNISNVHDDATALRCSIRSCINLLVN